MRWCGCSFDILIYSGDADFILNHMGSVNWITAATGLNASVAVPWQKWLGSDGQVAGYYEMCVPAFAHSNLCSVSLDRVAQILVCLCGFVCCSYTGLTFLTVKGAGAS
jgi:hypothetical protein